MEVLLAAHSFLTSFSYNFCSVQNLPRAPEHLSRAGFCILRVLQVCIGHSNMNSFHMSAVVMVSSSWRRDTQVSQLVPSELATMDWWWCRQLGCRGKQIVQSETSDDCGERQSSKQWRVMNYPFTSVNLCDNGGECLPRLSRCLHCMFGDLGEGRLNRVYSWSSRELAFLDWTQL